MTSVADEPEQRSPNHYDHDEPDDPHDPVGSSEDGSSGDGSEARTLPAWLVPALIGLVTITAGLLTWRAGQLGSSAAYEDRQSVGQTITQQKQVTEAGLRTTAQASGYVSYVADLAQAEALADLAAEASEQGHPDVATALEEQARRVVESADQLAEAKGVLSEQEILRSELSDEGRTVAPGFDVQERFEALETEAATGIASPGVLDPDAWASRADGTRAQVLALRHATVFMLMAVAAYTVAELARRRATRLAGFAVGGVIYLVTLIAVLPRVA